MTELLDVEVPAISKHLSNIFSERELKQEATISKMEIVQPEGGRNLRQSLDFYNLDAIISVGYRVNSHNPLISQVSKNIGNKKKGKAWLSSH